MDSITRFGDNAPVGMNKEPERWIDWRLGAAALLLFSIPLAVGLFYQSGYEKAATHSGREYARDTEQQVGNSCRDVPPTQQVVCFANARIEADLKQQEYEHNQADLVAQRKSALWTALMGLAAFAGMALSLIGVILVYRTFRATHEANDIARDSLAAENRAWIEIEPNFWKGDLRFEKGEWRLKVAFGYQNVGNSVALNVRADAILLRDPMMRDGPDRIKELCRELSATDRFLSVTKFPTRSGRHEPELSVLDKDVRLQNGGEDTSIRIIAVCFAVRYRTVFDRPGDEPHFTIEVYSLRRLDDGRPALAMVGENDVPGDELAFVQTTENHSIVT